VNDQAIINPAASVVPPPRPIRPLARPVPRAVVWLTVLALVVAGGLTLWRVAPAGWWKGDARSSVVRVALPNAPLPFRVEDLSVDPDKLEKISPTDAVARNAAIPLTTEKSPAARTFSLVSGQASDWERAVECLTTAIYYEAALEPVDGQRAVAQVILNRVRHPLYPKTVCGVVYEGHERRTGCQFSFTCDGSLVRKPVTALWDRARKIAAAALAGSVYTPVGWSTNYHADYVVPVWITKLLKVSVVGRHIFYRLPGTFGSPGAFNLAYAGNEPVFTGQDQALALDETLTQVDEGGVVSAARRPLLANSESINSAPATPTRPTARWLLSMEATTPDSASASAAAAGAPASAAGGDKTGGAAAGKRMIVPNP